MQPRHALLRHFERRSHGRRWKTGLAGWRGRIRTTESIRIVSAVAVEGVAEAVAVALQVGIALQDQVFHVVRQSEVSGRIDFRGPQQFNTIIDPLRPASVGQ